MPTRLSMFLCLFAAAAAFSARAEPAPAAANPALLPASVAVTPGFPPLVPGAFTIAVVPDTQFYSQKYPEIFHQQIQWISDNIGSHQIKFVLQLGDITETAADVEWKVAQEALGRIDGKVPYSLAPGNHDYGGRLQILSHRSPFSSFFPVSHFEKMRSFGGVYDKEPEKADNQFHTFETGGRKWLVVALEFGPRNDVLRWANDVLSSHPAHTAIIITHAYLEPRTNQRIEATSGYGSKAKPGPTGAPAAETPDLNLGVGIWEKLISLHPNVALVMCGHACYTSHKTAAGKAGNLVHEVVVDYQKDVNGGNGWMRLLQFLPDGKTVRSRDFSPALNVTCTMPDRSYDMELNGIPSAR